MPKTVSIALAAAATAVFGLAVAQTPPGPPPAAVQLPPSGEPTVPERTPAEKEKVNLKFQSLDGNRDGMISKMEAHGDEDMERQFQSLDRDADGDVSLTEFSAFEIVPPGRKPREPGELDPPSQR